MANEWFNEKKKSNDTEPHEFLDAANLQAVTAIIVVQCVHVATVEVQIGAVDIPHPIR